MFLALVILAVEPGFINYCSQEVENEAILPWNLHHTLIDV